MTSRPGNAGLAALVALLAAAAGADRSSGAAGVPTEPAATGRVLVVVHAPALPAADATGAAEDHRQSLLAAERRRIDDVADDAGLRSKREIPEIGVFAVPNTSVGEVRKSLAGDPRVVAVERDQQLTPRYTPNDPGLLFSDPNAPGNDFGQWNLVREGFLSAWSLSRGSGAKVAVIDSGADVDHPELAGAETLDRDGTYDDDPHVEDDLGHGTHVAGLACGDSDNGFGTASAGFDCDLLVIKTDFFNSSIADSIIDATDRGTDAINLSLGGPAPSTALREAIDYAWSHDSIPVAAADNHVVTNQGYPAEYVQKVGTASNVDEGKGLVVTAAEHGGARADFAGFGNGVSVAAYGSAFGDGSGGMEGVLSTFPELADAPNLDALGVRTLVGGDPRFAYLEGTSMATPQVAGLIALIRSVRPSMSAGKVVKLIKQTAGNRGTFSSQVGWGLIDAYAAVAGALGKDITNPSSKVRARLDKPSGVSKSGAGSATLKIKRLDVERAGMPTSGLKTVSIYVSRNKAPYRLLRATLQGTLRFRPAAPGSYRFYSVAVDQSGNVEAVPARADAKVKL